MAVAQKRRHTTNRMRDRILLECAKLFALDSFAAVSMRDIAEVVGIKSSSIYNYFDSKEELLEEILRRFELEYNSYFVWLNEVNKNVETLEGMLDNMFQKLFEVEDLFTYYGIIIVLKEQYANSIARDIVLRLFHGDNVRSIRKHFDRLVERGVIPPCNTETIAAFFMNNVLVGTELRIHELMQTPAHRDCTSMYRELKALLAHALRLGMPATLAEC